MNKILFITILLFCISNLQAQNGSDIVIGKIDSIYSKILDEEREIWIHVPGQGTDDIYEETNYPVVYLLDGDAHFHSVVGMIHQLSSVNGNSLCPKMIVVAILNTNRTRDLTPTKGTQGHPYTDSTLVAESGGGEAFISFIEKELFPYIDSNYPTDPYRMLIGHSFGGLLAVHTLIHRPELFNSYVSIDPSMWWSDKQLLGEIEETDFDDTFSRKSLYLGIANTMSEGMDTATAMKDTTIESEHLRSILELNTLLDNAADSQLKYEGKYYAEDGHSSVPLITEYDALRFIFNFYQINLNSADFSDPKSDILGQVQKHYAMVSEEFHREVLPDESLVNNLGYTFMGMEQYDRAESFFKLNVENFPTSFNVFDSLGDYYLEVGDKKKAIESFKKSIALNKDSYSKEKLEELLK